ncbi:ParB/RepB/Spo0J family partition protein [Thalassorhabdomicrobium marinisediminis]|uniref:Chromosome partitioning protein ParB n=1 Tax=Thalassorhabdomicrobium marinisediminis TaxID=2170577 RepID=A0A2T7FSU3_9RHOB|nr:ParB N-terminal domain-containing protein [Thalassorhabdomicrobium marinisediminis]PVA05213.1 chromosome partitioning protein ParB [Thalassorhabdomicrobium marinisediminis]
MSTRNKFGFGPLDATTTPLKTNSKRNRSVGPMGAAVRETAGSLQDSTGALAEQRRKNAADAKAFASARESGLVLERVPLSEINANDLPRDRLDLESVAASDEMEELKASIRSRGQREPVELYRDSRGHFQIKKGWRRFTALSQLLAETGDTEAYGQIVARVEAEGADDRMARYVDMVEENVIREDLSFAEMAMVAISASRDGAIEGADPEDLVPRLYASLHKMKRSYIKSFVLLLKAYGPDLKFPKAIPRNLGVEVVRKGGGVPSNDLRRALKAAETPEAQNAALSAYASQSTEPTTPARKQPRSLQVGSLKVEARKGRITLSGKIDYRAYSDADLTKAIEAFAAALKNG